MTEMLTEDSSKKYYLRQRHAEAVIMMKEVLTKITRPISVAEIARTTGFNRVTVEKHISNILRCEPEVYREIGTAQLGNSLVYYRKSEKELNEGSRSPTQEETATPSEVDGGN